LSTPLIQLLFVNLYLGAAEGALEDAVAYVSTTTRAWPTSGVGRASDDPYILESLGRLTSELAAARALADVAAVAIDDALERRSSLTATDRGAAAVTCYQAKVVATRVALEVTSGVFEAMGARATSERHGFDRRWRDVRVHSLHDPIAYKAREVGVHVLSGGSPAPSNYS
jgi:alkylation response protein AidB-like acyl-CoA dehydrogenase